MKVIYTATLADASQPRQMQRICSNDLRTQPIFTVGRCQNHSTIKVAATLLDESQYHCNPITIFRLLDAVDQPRERRENCPPSPYSSNL